MAANEKTRKQSAFINYLDESYQEVRKVSWPTRNQAVRLTFLVLGFCLVAAIIVGAFDFGFFTGYKELTKYANTVVPPAAVTSADLAAEQPINVGGVEATGADGQPITINTVDTTGTGGQPLTVTTEPVAIPAAPGTDAPAAPASN